MAKTLEELMAELEAAAKDRMKTSVPVPESDATIYESDVTIPGADSTLPESDTVYGRTDPVPAAGEYKKGQTLLDTYTVESDPIHGGMGSVWRVHHNGWNVDLAMKRPQAKLFQSEKQKENFIEECKAWIDLGLHPNIVSCYYVREIDGVPTIFSEWMENGSLENHIQKGTLYAGTTEEQQERLLDIAVQFARGLHYAHEQGLIHQDVKPDNVLLTKDWEAKVADFGLAKARAQLTILEGKNTVRDAGATVVTPSGGYTPAYCSMEQMDGKPLTRRTDIYSWAVSVMEMYLGERLWDNGVVVGYACTSYFESCCVSMPEGLKTLLKKCMAEKPENRPHDFGEVESELQRIYLLSVGRDYPRRAPKAAADTAESLNNRALSFLDLGKREEAQKYWRKALEQNAACPEAVYNYGVNEWLAGRIDDLAAMNLICAIPDVDMRLRLGRELAVMRGVSADNDEILFDDLIGAHPVDSVSDRRLYEGFTNGICRTFEKSGITCLIGFGKFPVGQKTHNFSIVTNAGPFDGSEISGKLEYSISTSQKPCGDESGFFARSSDGIVFYSVRERTTREVFHVNQTHQNVNSVCSGLTGNEYYATLDGDIWYCTVEPETEKLIYQGECACLSLTMSRDGKKLAFSSGPDGDKWLYLLDAESGTVLWKKQTGTHPSTMEFGPNGLLYAGYSGHFMSFDADGTVVMDCPVSTKGTVRSICFSADAAWALTGHSVISDKGAVNVRLWDLKRRYCARSMLISDSSSVYPFFTTDKNGDNAIGAFTTMWLDRNSFTKITLVPVPTPRSEPAWELSRIRNTGYQLSIDEQFGFFISEAEAARKAGDISAAVRMLDSAGSLEGKRYAPERIRLYRALAAGQEKRCVISTRLIGSFDKMRDFCLSEDGAFLLNNSNFRSEEEFPEVWSVDGGNRIYSAVGKKPRMRH